MRKKVLPLQKKKHMERAFESLSLFAFQQRFASDRQCLAYLSAEKWRNGYACPKCGHTHYCAGESLYSRQCTRCKHTDSPTAGTLFHKLKFSLLKAFYIVYFVSTTKNGISSTELSRKLITSAYAQMPKHLMMYIHLSKE